MRMPQRPMSRCQGRPKSLASSRALRYVRSRMTSSSAIAPLDGFSAPAAIEPVEIEIVRVCAFKAKSLICRACKAERRRGGKGSECEHCGTAVNAVQRQGCARCGAAKGDRVHIGAPPSLNVLGSGDPAIYMGMKARWQAHLAELLDASRLPRGLAQVMVEGEVTFPDRTRRDQGNFRTLIEKALGDALVNGGGDVAGGWLDDDDWEHYEFGGLAYRYERGVSRTRLMLFPRA